MRIKSAHKRLPRLGAARTPIGLAMTVTAAGAGIAAVPRLLHEDVGTLCLIR